MTQPSHIPLDQRKFLSCRLAFIDATGPLEEKFALAGGAHLLDYARDVFNALSDAGSKPQDQALDTYLSEVISTYKPVAQALFKNYPALFEEMWTAIENRVKEISCSVCSKEAGLSPKICDGSTGDNELVDKGGLCIAPIRQIFGAAREAAYIYIKTYGTIVPPSSFPEVIFSTAFTNHPASVSHLQRGYQVNGQTSFDRDKQLSNVKLILTPRTFDLPTYLAIPYMLFHECIAHAFHAIYPVQEEPRASGIYDAFIEGWMDWVSYKVLEEVVSERGPAAHLSAHIPFAAQCLEEGRAIQFMRSDYKQAGSSLTAQMVLRGSQAARKVLRLLEEELCLPSDALPAFYRLSFDLNALHNFDAEKRSAFINMMNSIVERGSQRNRKAAHHLAVAVLIEYLLSNDVNLLIESCYNLQLCLT